MNKIQVLVEVSEEFAARGPQDNNRGERENLLLSEKYLADFAGYGLEITGVAGPIGLYEDSQFLAPDAFSFADAGTESLLEGSNLTSVAIECEMNEESLEDLKGREGVQVWPNSVLALLDQEWQPFQISDTQATGNGEEHFFDLARSDGRRMDCPPFRPPVSLEAIRDLLSVKTIWDRGFRGQNVLIAVFDTGIHPDYPVVGGWTEEGLPKYGQGSIESHGSMCAADALIAAPQVMLLDYPLFAESSSKRSGSAIAMYQDLISKRVSLQTPIVASNSYGFYWLPSRDSSPNHEAYDPKHPLNRKIIEAVNSGITVVFAAGNCGSACPTERCDLSAIGNGKSISGSNSLEQVLTVGAVNSRHEPLGYSSEGPGTLHDKKPDLCGYSHFLGNFGPGRPAGGMGYDSGTSAACPVVAGVCALLLSGFSNLTPDQVKEALVRTSINIGATGWSSKTGWGVVNPAAAMQFLADTRFDRWDLA